MLGAPRRPSSCARGLHRLQWHGVFFLPRVAGVLLSLFCVALCSHQQGSEGAAPEAVAVAAGKCIQSERKVLLAVRADIWGAQNDWLSSWGKADGDDCCLWKRVTCDRRTGHVIELDLHRPTPMSIRGDNQYYCSGTYSFDIYNYYGEQYYDDGYGYYYDDDYDEYGPPVDVSRMSPFLLNLTSLRYLDLSRNCFDGASIPGFIGSMVNVEYLNLSGAGFGGHIPPQLGNLRNLHSLDLSENGYGFFAKNLSWLSHLSRLEYLNMGGVDLSEAADWLQVVSKLPSLSVLRLSGCPLHNLAASPPHSISFPILSTLDLSSIDVNATEWPLWLFNITTLTQLDLYSPNPYGLSIPDAFHNLKHLEVLRLGSDTYWEMPPPLPSLTSLNNLRLLDLQGIQLPDRVDKLLNLRKLVLSGVTDEIPKFLGNLSRLKYLEISWHKGAISRGFSQALGNLVNLKSLTLKSTDEVNGITELESLGNLSHLEYLYISFDCFGMPEKITKLKFLGNLSHLEYLYISCGCLRFTDTLGNLKRLETLHWMSDGSSIPESLGNLSNLRSLDLEVYGDQKIPESLGNLSNLLSLGLEVYGDQDQKIPESLGNLRNLRFLELRVHGDQKIPESLGNLRNLRFLELGVYGDQKIPESLGNLSQLETMHLQGYITELPESLTKAVKLKKLQLIAYSSNGGIIPESLGNLNNLQFLDLVGVTNEEFPESIGNLSNLEFLRLRGNIKTLPDSIGRLLKLKFMELTSENSVDNLLGSPGSLTADSNSTFEGIPKSLGNLVSLKILRVHGFNINDDLLRKMSHLCDLLQLHISGNTEDGGMANLLLEGLSQCSPESSLEYLDLRGNGFGGHLPEEVGHLSNLKYLFLGNNSIHSLIPESIGELQSLRIVALSGNKLFGHVPSSIGKLSGLVSLDLSSNNLTGLLSQAHFSNLSKLNKLDLSYNRLLSLSMNRTWTPPFQLETFLASNCKLGPHFPMWLEKQKNLRELDLSNSFIDDSLASNFIHSFPDLRVLNLSRNAIKGNLSSSLSLRHLESFDLSFNNFTALGLQLDFGYYLRHFDLSHNFISGPLSIDIGTVSDDLYYLDLSNNKISGKVPLSICQIKRLVVLDMSYNNLTGWIPDCWDNAHMEIMKFSHNNLHGTIPISFKGLPSLKSLHLDKNNLVGAVPSSFRHLSKLIILDLGHNQLVSSIPTWLGESLSPLQILSLRSNKFHGNIPPSLSQLQSLRILDFASNNFSGELLLPFTNFHAMMKSEKSTELTSFTHTSALAPASSLESLRIVPKGTEIEYTTTLPLFTIIDLSDNAFSGKIPEGITNLKALISLNMSRNRFEGEIPTKIGEMRALESLDLSYNQLHGKIPSSISAINNLELLNVSYNNLYGRIPSGEQLRTFDQFSYIGNAGLCGSPLPRPCPDDVTSQGPTSKEHEETYELYFTWLYIGIATGFVVGFWGFLGTLLLWENKRRMLFHFIDYVADELYIIIVVHFARLKRRATS